MIPCLMRMECIENSLKTQITGPKAKQMTVKQLKSLRDQCLDELPQHDPLIKMVDDLINERNEKKRPSLEKMISSSKNGQQQLSLKRLDQIQKECQEEFPPDDPLVENVRREIESRTKSLRGPIEEALKESDENTVRSLSQLQKKAILELLPDDSLIQEIKSMLSKRDKKVRSKLTSEYTALMKVNY